MAVRLRAQITVLVSIVTALVLALVCTSIKSAVDSTMAVRATMASILGIESAFSDYSRLLSDRFDVLLVSSSDSFYAGMLSDISRNCDNGQLGGLKATSITPVTEIAPVDNGGQVFAQEIYDYMQYGVFSEFASLLMDNDGEIKKQEKAGEIMEDISDCQESALKIEESMLSLVKVVDGLETTTSGFSAAFGTPNSTNGNFLKELCPGSVGKSNLAINDDRVYGAVEGKCVNVAALLEELLDDIKEREELIAEDEDDEVDDGSLDGSGSGDDGSSGGDGGSGSDGSSGKDDETGSGGDGDPGESGAGFGGSKNAAAIANLEASIYSNVSKLADLAEGGAYSCERGIILCDDYISGKEDIVKRATSIGSKITSSKEILGDELASGLLEDVEDMGKFDMSDALCDPFNMRIQLKSMQPLLDELESIGNAMVDCEGDGDYGTLEENVKRAQGILNKINYDGLAFDYSNVDFTSDSRGEKLLKQITSTLKNGIMGLVVEDVGSISKKNVTLTNLATDYESTSTSEDGLTQAAAQLKNKILYNTYVMDKFSCYGSSADEDGWLDYQVEYVLNGKINDYDNLYGTVLSLSALREASCLVSLFMDSTRKEECRTLSMGLFGFTGVPALVIVGQYAIMAGWAYGESLVDVRDLLSGGKVSLVKTRDNWKLGLDSLLAMKLDASSDDDKDGLDYNQFLTILLGLMNDTHKYYRTMALMEMWMDKQGKTDFRMCNQIYEASVEVAFSIEAYGRSSTYTRNVSYNY